MNDQIFVEKSKTEFEPTIIAFLCNWCSYTGADLAGTSRMKYEPHVRVIRVMCSGRVEPAFVLKAFAEGADGVLICGCHPGDCHYHSGNYKTLRRYHLLTKYLEQMGIQKDRFQLSWVSASEGRLFADVVNTMTHVLRKLGPSPIRENIRNLA
ncbi:MAG: hydrogenase iron-sulfur subunit [Deltaproteobacteria bacterium]|nr:hydrogenase iron-sulfur subunit [Deltaproteobacteria bacterium]